MKRLFKATVILSGASVIATGVKIINTKFIAIFLGPTGAGIFYQMVFFCQLAYISTCFGTRMGVTKYLSELKAQQDHEGIQVIFQTCMVSLIIFSILISLTAFSLADTISQFLFGTVEYAHYVRIVTLAIPMGVLMDFNQGVMYGFRMVNPIAGFNFSESVFCAVVFLPMIYLWGLTGAMVNVPITYCIQLILTILLLIRYSPVPISFNMFKRGWIKFRSVTHVIRYGFVSLIITFSRDLTITILFRRLIILFLGITANGIYAPAYGISFQMYALVYSAIYGYSFSKVSEARDSAEISLEINQLIRTLLLIMTPFIFILIGFRQQVILLLYTEKFIQVTGVMPIQFLGDFFKLLVLAISLPIHARADLKAMFFFEIGIYIFFYMLVRTLIPSMELMGAGWSYLLMYLVYFLVVTPYVMKKFHLRLEKKNIWIILTSLLLILAGSQLSLGLSGIILVSILLLGIWAGVTLTREEWVFGLEKSKKYLGKAAQFFRLR